MSGKKRVRHYDTYKHRTWREKVLRRAKYKCQECARFGKTTTATTAHHVLTIDERPDLRYDVSNGMALCASCHNKMHPEKGGYWR